MKKFFLILFLAAAFSLPAQAQAIKKLKGNGKTITQNRSVNEYDEIALEGAMEVELVTGTEGNLTIEAEENLLPHILTEVSGSELKISVKRGYSLTPSTNQKIKVTVPFKDLNEVSLTGSGNIYSSVGINSENFKTKLTGSGDIKLKVIASSASATLTGSGDIKLSGSAKDLTCKVTGSGDISAFDLQAEYVKAVVTGSGDIQVTASEELTASTPGSGDIQYRGNPKKEDFKSIGSGSISKN